MRTIFSSVYLSSPLPISTARVYEFDIVSPSLHTVSGYLPARNWTTNDYLIYYIVPGTYSFRVLL